MSHENEYPEWMSIDPNATLRQGDVLASIQESRDPWHKLSLILTADCDLARAKHDGNLSCIPILETDDYLLRFRYDKLAQPLQQKVGEALAQHLGEKSVSTYSVSPGRLLRWLQEAGADNVARTLEIDSDDDVFYSLSAAACALGPAPKSINDAVDIIVRARQAINAKSNPKSLYKSAKGDLCSVLRNLPGDAVFLSQASDEHTVGYVAYLRRVFEINDANVAKTMSRVPHSARLLRVSRLKSPYVYALSQQFGQVFSAIGLPESYEEARQSRIDSYLED